MASVKKKNKLYFKVGGVMKNKYKGVKGLHFYTPAQRKESKRVNLNE